MIKSRVRGKDWAAAVGRYCLGSVESLRALGVYTARDSKSGYTLIKSAVKNPIPVLAVAHIDTVRAGDLFPVWAGGALRSSCLDDRLGVWALLEGLPRLLGGGGVPFDVLLSECEESGNSTACEFVESGAAAGYNWAFMFDRAGADAVHYGLTSAAFNSALVGDGWAVGYGSYSCVSEFGESGACVVNFGAGYTAQHTAACTAAFDVVLWQVQRVARFVRRYGRVAFPCAGDWGGGAAGGYWARRAAVVGQSNFGAGWSAVAAGSPAAAVPVKLPRLAYDAGVDDAYWDAEYARHCDSEASLYGWDDVPAVAAGRKRRRW